MEAFRCRGLKSKRADCLNCPYEECRFDKSAKAKKSVSYPFRKKYEVARDYIIRRELTTYGGGFKVSYVRGATKQSSTSNINKATLMTLAEAQNMLKYVADCVSVRTKLFIVRKDEELERLKK